MSHALKDPRLQSDGGAIAILDPGGDPSGMGLYVPLGGRRSAEEVLEYVLAPNNPSIGDIHIAAKIGVRLAIHKLKEW